MKKLSSFLVLMLIALMLFVSCNGSTPTKEESNSSSNGSTPTVTERAATDEDYDLFITLGNVLIEDLTNRETLPEGCTTEQDNSTNTLSITFDSCEFDSFATNGSKLHVKLNGSATERTEGDPMSVNYVKYYTCSFTEGSSLGDTKFTANFEYSINKSMEINITSATINGVKINGFSELVKSKITREAKDTDRELANKIIDAIDYIISLETYPTGIDMTTNNNINEYTFTDYDFLLGNGTKYLFNGTLTITLNPNYTVDFSIDLFNNETIIDGKNYSIRATGIQTIDGTSIVYSFSEAIINCTYITNLVVEVPNPNPNPNPNTNTNTN